MSRYAVELRLDAPSGERGDLANLLTEESGRVRTRIGRDLGLGINSAGWVSLDPISGKGRRAIRQLIEVCRSGHAVAGSGIVRERPDEADTAAADWFLIETKTDDRSFSLWDDYPSFKSGSHPKGHHALNHTFVSEPFVETCMRFGLAGLSFLRCQNKGRKRVPPWFVALPDRSLGRGLDHPWFDRRLWIRDVGDRPSARFTSLETGQHCFHQCWLRDHLEPDEPFIKDVLELFPAPAAYTTGLAGLQFVTIPRYWSRVFPPGDFAYLPWGEDGPNREGKMMRFRLLMASPRARQALIDTGLLTGKSFSPVRSVKTPEKGVEVLDARYDPEPPMYTVHELAALRARERALFEAD